MRTWLPAAFLIGLALGAFAFGLNMAVVPFHIQAASVATFSGQAYADEQMANFARNPLLIRSHAALGSIFVVLAAFQFWRGFRNRHRRLHRIMGYAALACLVVLPVSGVASSIVYPFAGPIGVLPNVVWMVAILFCVGAGLKAIRRRDIVNHEAWVTRATAMTVGITLSRLYEPLLVQVFHMESHAALALVFWLGQGEGLIAAEFWLRRPGGPLGRKTSRVAARA
ncbi:MAG TPA: DUF2306 domain-containing protein [Rhizomicrobium sp.]|nr:DUF2306 domain-containing protein [Rhizomicrobium sp.]